MIKYLKKLWKKYFRSLGYSRIKTEVKVVKNTSTSMPVLIVKEEPAKPESLHCLSHTRFKKSCPVCQGVTS